MTTTFYRKQVKVAEFQQITKQIMIIITCPKPPFHKAINI